MLRSEQGLLDWLRLPQIMKSLLPLHVQLQAASLGMLLMLLLLLEQLPQHLLLPLQQLPLMLQRLLAHRCNT
jgi:hypothetical protein